MRPLRSRRWGAGEEMVGMECFTSGNMFIEMAHDLERCQSNHNNVQPQLE